MKFVSFNEKRPADQANLLHFQAEHAIGGAAEPRLDKALAKYQQVLELFPADVPKLLRVSDLQLELRQWELAADTASRLAELFTKGNSRRPLNLGPNDPALARMYSAQLAKACREIAQHQQAMAAMDTPTSEAMSQLRRLLEGDALTSDVKAIEVAHHAVLSLAIETVVRIKAKPLTPTLLRFCNDELPASAVHGDVERHAKYRHRGRNVLFRQAAWEAFVKLNGTPPSQFDPTAAKAERDQMLRPILRTYRAAGE